MIIDRYIAWRNKRYVNKYPAPQYLKEVWISHRCPWWVFGPASYQPWQFIKDFVLHMTLYSTRRRGRCKRAYLSAKALWYTRTLRTIGVKLVELDDKNLGGTRLE